MTMTVIEKTILKLKDHFFIDVYKIATFSFPGGYR